jgi:putative ABC transport system permease protein
MRKLDAKLTAAWETWPLPENRRVMLIPSAGSLISSQDVRYALRQLRRNPGFALAAVLTLALGIGATTAVFSVVDAVVLRPLSYADPSRLMMIDEWTPSVGSIPVNGLHFQEWRRATKSFERMALIGALNVNVTDSSEPERLPAARVSSELFPLLGVQPQLGRVFLPEEDVSGRDQVVLISHELWRRRYASDPQIVGRTISIDGAAHQVVGVLPADFHFPKLSDLYPLTIVQDRPLIWKPIALRPVELTLAGGFNFVSLGRLAVGISPSQAASELDAIQKGFSAAAPKAPGPDVRSQVLSLRDRIVGRTRTGLELVLAACWRCTVHRLREHHELAARTLFHASPRVGTQIRDRGQSLASHTSDDRRKPHLIRCGRALRRADRLCGDSVDLGPCAR